jgi:hypothetical protein
MSDQIPFATAVAICAHYAKMHSHLFVRDGAGVMDRDQTEAHSRNIEACADRMAKTRTFEEFEATRREMHRLGLYLRNSDVSQVAQADVSVVA